jgi:glycerate kinase
LAIIEMAQASGLTLVPAPKRDALHASSFGTGQLIRAALDAGYRDLLIGIGGSATTDGGAGALQALGMGFLDSFGNELLPGGAALANLAQIDVSGLHPLLAGANLRVLCDVTNPLCGAEGAATVYGPQKGASPRQARQLDLALNHYADVVASTIGRDERQRPGSGAAGGMGFGLLSFAHAELVPGIETVLQAADFAGKLDHADLVLTAEGAIDSQTQHGKALAGVAAAACRARHGRGVPVVAFGGAVNLSGSDLAAMGIGAALPLADGPMTLDECLTRAAELLSDAAERAVRLWLCGRRPQ